MIRYLFTRIKNKYKLYLSLIFGIISMVMIFSLIMMFRDGSLNKIIQNGFKSTSEERSEFPAYVHFYDEYKRVDLMEMRKDKKLTEVVEGAIEESEKNISDNVAIPVVSVTREICFHNTKAVCGYGDGEHIIDLGYLEDGSSNDINEHIDITEGVPLYESIDEYTKNGMKIRDEAYPVYVSRYTADTLNLVVGEELYFPDLEYADDPENPNAPKLYVYISGIIEGKHNDHFWNQPLSDMGRFFIMDKNDFEKITHEYTREIKSEVWELLDYRYINANNIEDVLNALSYLTEDGKNSKIKESISPILIKAKTENVSVNQMLYVIVLPLVILVLTFISMIAFRIVDSEAGELKTLRDRGLAKSKLISTHIYLSVILAFTALPFGIILSYFFGKLVAGVDDFCGFSLGGNGISVKDYSFNVEMIWAGVIAALMGVIVNVIPVLLFFRKKKERRRVSLTPFWEKYFLDVALLIVSFYLLFNYNRQLSVLAKGIMNGQGIDPIIFINSTLFLFACGLLMLRLIYYIIKLVFVIGKNKFPAIIYAGITQIMRSRSTSGVISVFLVVTVAMSVFNANMARTINSNKQARTEYNIGCDVRICEHWFLMLKGPDSAHLKWKYNEPDFGIYDDLLMNGVLDKATKVVTDDNASVEYTNEKKAKDVKLMAINTKEFGETAYLRDGLNKEHWYNYLNALAVNTNGVIISSNMAEKLGAKVGDKIIVYRYPPEVMREKEPYAQSILDIVAICDAFPGYERYVYENDEKGEIKLKEKYLAVMNYAQSVADFGNMPYEVWGSSDLSEGEISEALKEGYSGSNRYAERVQVMNDQITKEKSTAIIQITNGLFTADFLVALLLCVIGYMIYWITSIRDRGLLFGICRAMGITKGEIDRMLIIEQGFLSVMSIIAGVFAGTLTSRLFVNVFSTVYLPQKHNIDIYVESYSADIMRLLIVLFAVIILCMIWIRRIVGKLNISQALKLGED